MSNWDTSSVTTLYQTFKDANSFLGNVWRWNVGHVHANVENTFQNTPALRLCFKRFMHDLWSVQGVPLPDEWSSISSCVWSLTDALDDVPCFGTTPCTCTSIDPKRLRCLHCGRFSQSSLQKKINSGSKYIYNSRASHSNDNRFHPIYSRTLSKSHRFLSGRNIWNSQRYNSNRARSTQTS